MLTPKSTVNISYSWFFEASSSSASCSHRWALADCASILFAVIEVKKHNFSNEHCLSIISKSC